MKAESIRIVEDAIDAAIPQARAAIPNGSEGAFNRLD
jgi:hypothetical protein